MRRAIAGIFYFLACAILALSLTGLLLPLFGFYVGPQPRSMIVALVTATTGAIAWLCLSPERPSLRYTSLYTAALCGLGMLAGPLRGGGWGLYSARQWAAVVVGGILAVGSIYLLRRRVGVLRMAPVRLMVRQHQFRPERRAPRPTHLAIDEEGLTFNRGEPPQDESVLRGQDSICISWDDVAKISFNPWIQSAIKVSLRNPLNGLDSVWVQWLGESRWQPYDLDSTRAVYNGMQECSEQRVKVAGPSRQGAG